MKKLLSSIMAACLFTFAANMFAGPAEDMLAGVAITKDALVAMADKAKNKPDEDGGKPTLDPVAYEAIILAFKDAPMDAKNNYAIDYKHPAVQALNELRKKYILPSAAPFVDRLLENPSPAVRVKAVELLKGGLFGNSAANKDRGKKLLEKETTPQVQATIIKTFANDGGKEPEIGQFLVRSLDSADPVVRKMVAMHCCSSWNFKTPGLSEKLAALMLTEKDAKAREMMLNYAGKLGKDVICDSYIKILDGDESVDIKSKALKGLVTMWWYYPLYNTYCEKAYRKTLQYMPTIKDEASQRKLVSALGDLSWKSTVERTIKAYAENAPWYKAEEVRGALMPLVDYECIDAMTRAKLLKALYSHGAAKEEVAGKINKLLAKEGLGSFDKNQYERLLKEIEK